MGRNRQGASPEAIPYPRLSLPQKHFHAPTYDYAPYIVHTTHGNTYFEVLGTWTTLKLHDKYLNLTSGLARSSRLFECISRSYEYLQTWVFEKNVGKTTRKKNNTGSVARAEHTFGNSSYWSYFHNDQHRIQHLAPRVARERSGETQQTQMVPRKGYAFVFLRNSPWRRWLGIAVGKQQSYAAP